MPRVQTGIPVSTVRRRAIVNDKSNLSNLSEKTKNHGVFPLISFSLKNTCNHHYIRANAILMAFERMQLMELFLNSSLLPDFEASLLQKTSLQSMSKHRLQNPLYNYDYMRLS